MMKRTQPATRIDAISMLEEDHDKVKTLFEEYDSAEADEKEDITMRLFDELDIHAMLEEQIFYPAVKSRSKKEGKELVEEALEEHGAAKELIAELRDMEPNDDSFEDKFQHLRAEVEHHIQEEEDDMFPLAERVLAEDAERLGEEMQNLKIQLTSDAKEL